MAPIRGASLASGQAQHGEAQPLDAWVYGRWADQPAQGRSERTFFRFLDAAETLLRDKHWHDISIHEIVDLADASVGSFYNRFSDKDALLHCLDDRLAQECERTLESLAAELKALPDLGKNAPDIAVSLLMRLCTERGGIVRALDLATKMADDCEGSGFGFRFERALMGFAEALCASHDQYADLTADRLFSAFLETFWLAREMLLYHQGQFDGRGIHATLMRHFRASLNT